MGRQSQRKPVSVLVTNPFRLNWKTHLGEKHQDGVHYASPDGRTRPQTLERDGEANTGKEKRLKDVLLCVEYVFLESVQESRTLSLHALSFDS